MGKGSGIGTFDPGAIITRSLMGSPSPSTASQFHFHVSRTQRTLFQLQRVQTRIASAFCGVKTARKWAAVWMSRASYSACENS